METEILVIGGGIAGLSAAVFAAEKGFDVTLISKTGEINECNTWYAQGGIVYNRAESSPAPLVRDVVTAGDGLVKREIARIVAEEGWRCIDDLLIGKARVPFKRAGARFSLTREAAHSRRRVLFAFDATGRYILEYLLQYAKKFPNIRFLTSLTAIDILTRDHHTDDLMAAYEKPEALGCYAYDHRKKKVLKIIARATILASGGVGRLYKHTTNPEVATADGIAMAHRAGAKIINMEYTQFHPTSLFAHSERNFLLTESLRGEGGVIVDQAGKEFIRHPSGSLAPRDVVSIEIRNRLIDTDKEFVYLDLSRIKGIDLKERYPTIYRECMKNNVDITRDRIPVVPAFHFLVGGVRVNEWGRTSILNLYASGECSCTGLHGANRLASMSLLEGLVFSRRIVRYLAANRKQVLGQRFPEVRDWIAQDSKDTDPILLKQDWETLRNTMWNYVGIVRTPDRLNRAIKDLNNLNLAIEDFYRHTAVTREILELRNAVQAGLLIAQAAWRNKVSRGCHYRVND
jgi:L-aspartate oxidase